MRLQTSAAFHFYDARPSTPPAQLPAPSAGRWQARLLWNLGVSSAQLYRAQFLAATWKVDAGNVLLCDGVLGADAYCAKLADACGFAPAARVAALGFDGPRLRVPPRC